jgi:hypothetical protein
MNPMLIALFLLITAAVAVCGGALARKAREKAPITVADMATLARSFDPSSWQSQIDALRASGTPVALDDNIQYPYPQPTYDAAAGTVTVDLLATRPNIITRIINNIALRRYYIDYIFSPAGSISGGAVSFEQATENDLFAQRDVSKVMPGDEFPTVTFDRAAPRTAQVEKFGGKFPITDEARRRNQIGRVNRAMLQLANTITRKTQQRALAELDAAITEHSRIATGTSWRTASTTVEASRLNTVGPVADVTQIELANEQLELGYTYNTAVMNPQEWRNGVLAYGSEASLRAILSASGISTIWVTNRQTAGKIKWLAARQVGELGYEVPLSTETWRDPEGRQQNWYQAFVLPIVYVTDPFAILETSGHNA